MESKQIENLVSQLVELKREYNLLVFDEELQIEIGSPTSKTQIEELEKRFGNRLPKSYCEFLALHNGWHNFEGDGNLLSVEDYQAEWVKDKVAFWSNLWDVDSENPFDSGAIPILLGETRNSFLVYRPERESGKGQFVMYDYMQEFETYKDFYAYLESHLDVMHRLIDIKKRGVYDEEE